jgi:uncharacterized phosphosugar-binding protein
MNPAYLNEIRRLLDTIESTQAGSVAQAADRVAEALIAGRMVHLFGKGHAHMLCEEFFYRAGGMLPINPILDSGLMLDDSALGSSQLERLPGYARIVLAKHPLETGDIILIASNSGVNAVPVEAAIEAHEMAVGHRADFAEPFPLGRVVPCIQQEAL